MVEIEVSERTAALLGATPWPTATNAQPTVLESGLLLRRARRLGEEARAELVAALRAADVETV